MKWSFASVGLIVLGLIGVAVIMLFQRITTNNENDYYLLKEVTEAAMIDAIDISYYRETGDLKIIREKFVENFTRRFAESTIFVTNDYKINFYDIMETPPKVSIFIDTGLGEYTIYGDSAEYNIANKLDAILEYTGKYTNVSINDSYYGKPYVSNTLIMEYYAMPYRSGNNDFDVVYSLKVPDNLNDPNVRNIRIEKIEFVGNDENKNINQGELNEALLRNELSYNNLLNNQNVISGYIHSINDFGKRITNLNTTFYNCESNTGEYSNKYDCDDDYYVSISGSTSDSDKSKVIIKYKVTWSYEEYEF